jgi:two-component system, LuxR family, sensor kinase FixL
MSPVTIIWSVAAGAAVVLGLVHALVWGYDRHARGNLAFAIAAFGLAVGAIVELGMLHATTPHEWGEWVWWMQIPIFLVVAGMALFLRLYLGAGRLWLLASVLALRGTILVLNFFSEPNFNFERVDAIAQISLLGEQVTVATSAVTGQHQWLALFAALLFPVFLTDVVVTLWRRRTPEATRAALVLGLPMLVSVLISLAMTQLVIWRVVQAPILLIPSFLLALGAMALEVSRNVLRASRLAHDLRESEQRLELAANAAGAGLWAWDSRSGRIWATHRARTILGLPQTSDLDPADILKVLDAADASELRAGIERHGEHAMHFRIMAPDGQMHWIEAHGTVEPDARGKLTLVRGVLRDVTQQRQAEDDAAELRRKLAHAGRVTMLGQLSAALAHELSQPLSAILQNAEAAAILLARDPVDMEEVRAIVGDVLRDDRRAAEVVQRLRAWLKQGQMNLEELGLHELAQDVLALVRADAAAKHVAIECAVPRTLPPVFGDRVQLSQVLLNLVMNAIDAMMEANDAPRRVLVVASVGGDRCCEVSVSDTGPGIPQDSLDRIFDPFFTAKTEGLGIGLSISRSIVEAHGGKLWAENCARGGATFHFTVPLQSQQPASAA